MLFWNRPYVHTLEDIIVSGDRAACRMRIWATHTGAFGELPATGRSVDISAHAVLRCDGTRIAEAWQNFDLASLLRQIGPVTGAQSDATASLARAAFACYASPGFAEATKWYSAGFVHHDDCNPARVTYTLRAHLDGMRETAQAFPDFRIVTDEVFAEGDRALVRWRFAGTNTTAMGPFPGNGKKVECSCITTLRCANGQVMEAWSDFDLAGMLKQLGVKN